MPAFLIAMVKIHDMDTYKQYTALTPKTIADHQGKFVVRGGEVDTLEGEAFQERLVILEFPSRQAVHDWYNSPEYQAAAKIRQQASKARFIVVDKLPEGLGS